MGDLIKQPKEVLFLENGNTLVAGGKGEQIPELQVSWIGLYKEFLKSKGIEPEKIKFLVFNNKEDQ